MKFFWHKRTSWTIVIPIVLLLILAGSALVLISTIRFGPGLTPDSVNFLEAARNLSSGNGFETYGGTFVSWPPLYSVTLAGLASFIRTDPLQVASGFNAVIFALILLCSGILMFLQFDRNVLITIYGIAAILLSSSLIHIAIIAFSEPLFILFTVLYLIVIKTYSKNHELRLLVIAAVFAALSCLTKYIGITLIMTGTIIILLIRAKKPIEKLRHLLIFGFVASFPLVIWLFRNYTITHTLFGPRWQSEISLGENIYRVLTTISSWLFGSVRFWESWQGLLMAFLCLLIAGSLSISYSLRRSSQHKLHFANFPTPELIYIMVYTAYLVFSATLVAFDSISDRLLTPIYIPLLLLFLWLTMQVTISLRNNALRLPLTVLIIFLLSTWLLFSGRTTYWQVNGAYQQGAGGYNTERWHNDGLVRYLNEHPLENLPIYSNAPDAMYILTNHKATFSVRRPFDVRVYTPTRPSNMEDLGPGDFAYLVWFEKVKRPYLLGIEDLTSDFTLIPVVKFSDGTIYQISGKSLLALSKYT